jgi:hypothetical protein
MRRLVVLAVGLISIAAGCVRGVRPDEPFEASASCTSACSYYVECRQSSDPELDRSCLAECQTIFVTDGVVDEGSLRELEELECYDLVAFVEGPSGRPPGVRAATPDADGDGGDVEASTPAHADAQH